MSGRTRWQWRYNSAVVAPDRQRRSPLVKAQAKGKPVVEALVNIVRDLRVQFVEVHRQRIEQNTVKQILIFLFLFFKIKIQTEILMRRFCSETRKESW